MESKINRIARKLVIAAGNNVFDDYFTFYSDGAWVVEVVRNLIKYVNAMLVTPGSYTVNISKLDEYVNYLSQVKLDDMNTSSSVKEINSMVKDIKKDYDKYEESLQENKNGQEFLKKYNDELQQLKTFLMAYQSSCVNVFKNRYIQDEDNVSNLLSVIHDKGNYVFNKK